MDSLDHLSGFGISQMHDRNKQRNAVPYYHVI